MPKIKYQTKMPETYKRGAKTHYRGQKAGPKSVAEKRALIYPQAENVIRKFGGARELARVLKDMGGDYWNPSTIYRWTYPIDAGGTGGEIPTRAIKTIVRAARYAGIMLTLEDLYPNIF